MRMTARSIIPRVTSFPPLHIPTSRKFPVLPAKIPSIAERAQCELNISRSPGDVNEEEISPPTPSRRSYPLINFPEGKARAWAGNFPARNRLFTRPKKLRRARRP
jgi:hypothetical protein